MAGFEELDRSAGMSGQKYLDNANRRAVDDGVDPWVALMRVLLIRLRELHLPAPLLPALQQAVDYWHGQSGDLASRKLEVWQYINSHWRPGADLKTRAGRTARSLLCVLEPDGSEQQRSETAECSPPWRIRHSAREHTIAQH